MEKFCVATDSGCDLSLAFCRERGIHPLPLSYLLGDKVIPDTMCHEDILAFYDQMRAGAVPKTSQINTAEFVDFWTELLPLGLPIVHICLGSGISGTYTNGLLAIELLHEDHPEAEIYLVDSTLASLSYGMLAIEAARMRDEGLTPQQCVAWLEAKKPFVNAYYTTGDLTYLYRGGRVSRTGLIISRAMNINPILNLDLEGHLLVQEKARGRKATWERMYAIIQDLALDPGEQTLYISHSDFLEEAMTFGAELQRRAGFKDVFYSEIGPIIGAHAGPGLFSVFFCGKKRTMKHG